jgi:hypothetical protein
VNLWSWLVVLFTEDRRLDRHIAFEWLRGRNNRRQVLQNIY